MRASPSRTVLHDVSFEIREGCALGLVGESGSGKSMTTKAIMRLLPKGSIATGELTYQGESVLAMNARSLARFRASEVGMIFQEPRAHTNPLSTVGDFLIEAVVANKLMTRDEAADTAVHMLREVGIPDGARRMKQFPHQLSGGLLQRMMIVMALMPSPKLLLADEPTTALDVTVQSDVMAILDGQRRERQLGMLFITHDLDLAAAVCDDLAVMYAGVIVEKGGCDDVHGRPLHPYTAGLLASRPSIDHKRELITIPGRPVSAFEAGPGCVFVSRCPFTVDRCLSERPQPRQVEGRDVACHRSEEIAPELQAQVVA
jgi:peptide/nickel transport system ATP-binding protein